MGLPGLETGTGAWWWESPVPQDMPNNPQDPLGGSRTRGLLGFSWEALQHTARFTYPLFLNRVGLSPPPPPRGAHRKGVHQTTVRRERKKATVSNTLA